MPVNIEFVTQVDNALRDMARVDQSFTDMHKVNQDAAGALGVFGVSLSALNNPITAVASGIKDSIDTTMAWGETIDKLTRSTGMSAEQASKMAVVFGDFGIKTDSLDKVVKQFTKNGLSLNLDTIKKLAIEYQAIKDPVERDRFAFDNFGRSGLEMNEILSKTPEQLQAVGDAAMYSGKIMSEQGVEGAQNFGVKLQQLGDKADGVKIAVGGPMVDALSNAVDGFTGVTAVANLMGIALQQKLGIINDDQAAARADAAAHGDLFAEFHNVDLAAQSMTVPLDQVKDDTLHLADNTNASAVAYSSMLPVANGVTASLLAMAPAIADANAKTAESNALLAVQDGMMGALTAQMVFQTAASHLDAAGQDELAHKLGLMNDATYNAITAIQGINKKLDEHLISVDNATSAEASIAAQAGLIPGAMAPSTQAVRDFNAAMDAMHDKTINIVTNHIDNYGSSQNYGDQGANAGTNGTGHAAGGTWTIPPGYSNDSFPLGALGYAQSGEQVTITPAGQAGKTGMTINVDARGSTDPAAVEAAGYRGALRAMQAAGYQADQLARMGVS